MKKRSLLLLPLMLAALAGCGETDEGGSGKIEVIMWHNSNDTTANLLKNFVTAFEKENPDIHVTLSKQSGGYEAILTATETGLAAGEKGTYPDIFLGYPDSVAKLMMTGKVVNLQTLIDDSEVGWSEATKADFIQEYLDEGKHYQIPGIYSAPYAKSTEALYYNKVLLGLDLSSIDATINGGQPLTHAYLNDLTWEELFNKLCPALLEKNKTDNFLDTTTDANYSILNWSSDDNAFITICEQYGLPYTTYDPATGLGQPAFNDASVKAKMKWFYEAKEKHYFGTKKSHSDTYTNGIFTKKQALFDIGSTGGGQYYGGDNNKNIDIRLARIPHAEGKARKVINQGPSLAIIKHGNNMDRVKAAWKFYNFVVNEKNASAFSCVTGYSPIRYSVYDTPEWQERLAGINADERTLEKIYALIAEYTETVTSDLFTSYVFNGSAACRTQVLGLMGKILNQSSWSDSVVKNAFDDAENTARLACY